jgi:cytochrome P450
MLTPSFHFKILEQFVEVFNRNGDILVQRLSSHVDGPEFDITHYIVSCTLDVICGELLSVSHTARAELYFAH